MDFVKKYLFPLIGFDEFAETSGLGMHTDSRSLNGPA
jgi:hypothetical protein